MAGKRYDYATKRRFHHRRNHGRADLHHLDAGVTAHRKVFVFDRRMSLADKLVWANIMDIRSTKPIVGKSRTRSRMIFVCLNEALPIT
jgi:hypothetical protein